MKITKETLKKIIKEEIDKVLKKEASETTGQMLQRTAKPVDPKMRKLLDAWLRGEEEGVPRYLYIKHPGGKPKDGILLSKEEAEYVLERGGMEVEVKTDKGDLIYVRQP